MNWPTVTLIVKHSSNSTKDRNFKCCSSKVRLAVRPLKIEDYVRIGKPEAMDFFFWSKTENHFNKTSLDLLTVRFTRTKYSLLVKSFFIKKIRFFQTYPSHSSPLQIRPSNLRHWHIIMNIINWFLFISKSHCSFYFIRIKDQNNTVCSSKQQQQQLKITVGMNYLLFISLFISIYI